MIAIKKNIKIVIFSMITVLLISLGVGGYFIINGSKKIYKIEISENKITERIKYIEITNETDEKYLDKTKYAYTEINSDIQTSRTTVINDITKYEIAKIEAKNANTYLDYDKTTELYEERINIIKSDENYYNGLKIIISEKGISEEEYFRIAKEIANDYYNNFAYQDYYQENYYNEEDDASIYQQYDNYMNELVKNSKVKVSK